MNEILAEKLRWTFQVDKLGDMVTRGAGDALKFQMKINSGNFEYQFSKDTVSKIVSLNKDVKSKDGNSFRYA